MRALSTVVLLVAVAFSARGQSTDTTGALVLTRNSILRSGPSVQSAGIETLTQGSIVTVVATKKQSTTYIKIRTQDEQVGYVTRRNVKPVDETEVHQPSGPASAPAAVTGLSPVAGAFDGCVADGNVSPNAPHRADLMALNDKKNRSAEPAAPDLDASVTIGKVLASSNDDTHRWNDAKAAEIVAYVYRVIPGGAAETANCRKGDPVHRDSHVEVTLNATDTAETQRMIVEVTPRWRAAAKAKGIDWSTKTLQSTIEGHWVRIRGWMLFDAEHSNAAENTNPGGSKNWRATSWEIHPVTSLEIVPHP